MTPKLAWAARLSAGLLFAIPACTQEPPKKDLARLKPREVVDYVLQRCHNLQRGRMDNSFLEMTELGPGITSKVLLGTDHKHNTHYLRVDEPDGLRKLLHRHKAWSYRRKLGTTELKGKPHKLLNAINALLRTALLRPLYRAKKVEYQSGPVYRITTKEGETWRLELNEKTHLPVSLTGPPGKLEFLEYKATGVTFLPKVIALGEFGKHEINLLGTDLVFNEWAFYDPEAPEARAQRSGLTVMQNTPRRNHRPRAVSLEAKKYLLIEDPGDWGGRVKLQNEHIKQLEKSTQFIADLTAILEIKGKRYMGIPFGPHPNGDSKPFQRQKGQKIHYQPGQKVVVVYARRKGTAAEDIAAGHKLLKDYLARKGLRAAGNLRVIPYWLPEDGPPSKEKLQTMDLRLELPVRKK